MNVAAAGERRLLEGERRCDGKMPRGIAYRVPRRRAG